MKANTTIDLTPQELDSLRGSVGAGREKAMGDIIQSRPSVIDPFLAPFCNGLREQYLDGAYRIDDVSFDHYSSGTITVSFEGDVYLGCKDMDHLEEHTAALTFTVDWESSVIALETYHPDERNPDEY